MLLVFLTILTFILVGKAGENTEDFFKKYKVIFLPEEHTSKEDHRFQLDFIRYLALKDHRLIIAMEMFQQPFQEALDQYIACQIEEEEMLQRTEYYRRWGYDPTLYRDIWRFAKEKGIRIVAINLPSELVQRIGKEGLERVRDDLLPFPPIQQTERELKKLRQVLENHPRVEERRFFDVQNAWDNGMALAIARLSDHYPDHTIVVLIGRGHAEDYDSGVPRRLKLLRPHLTMKILKREDFQRDLLFSIDFSKERSSASSIREPNCKP